MGKASLSPGQHAVIEKFVEIRRARYPGLQIEARPDESNRTTSDIDAIAGIFAIEHTSVDSISEQRRNNASFLEILPDDEVLTGDFKFRASVFLSWDGISLIQNRAAMKAKLTQFVQDELLNLPNGMSQISRLDFPFKIYVNKRPQPSPRIYFGRSVNDDPTLPKRVADQIVRKAEKLAPYKEAGKTTVLLLESEDIAMMNQDIMLEAIEEGFKELEFPESLDELWYADTTLPKDIKFINFTKLLTNKRIELARRCF